MRIGIFGAALLGATILAGCSGDDDDPHPGDDTPKIALDVYEFSSRFDDASSVSYSGQTLRHVLIADLKELIGGLDDQIATEADFDPSTVEERLLGMYEFDSDTLGARSILISSDPALEEKTYDDISSGKNLFEKVAGQDGSDHKDWSSEFKGWSDTSISDDISSPDKLLRAFFKTIGENATLTVSNDPSRERLKVYQTEAGQDLSQLVQKFLLGAVAFSQGADDYLDEGLNGENEEAREGSNYTALEHAWDEGFGYFGAARDYLNQSDESIADGAQSDADENGSISLLTEFNFGASVNAAKRDKGSTSGTDFTNEAMTAFLKGRHLISNGGSKDEIKEQAGAAVLAWEKAISATVVHYINDTLADHAKLGTDNYDFGDHSKHWSELKGFALGFQFNPNSPMSDEDFERLHDLVGDAPVLETASDDEKNDYKSDLLEARGLLMKAYGFESDDVQSW